MTEIKKSEIGRFAHSRPTRAEGESNPAVAEAAFSNATIYPANALLPDDFKNADFSKSAPYRASCLYDGTPCEIVILPFGGPGESAIIVRAYNKESTSRPIYLPTSAQVFQRDREGKWVNSGNFQALGCPDVVDALRDGRVTRVRPQYDDLSVDGIRLRFFPTVSIDDLCANEPVSKSTSDGPVQTREVDAPAQVGPAFGKP